MDTKPIRGAGLIMIEAAIVNGPMVFNNQHLDFVIDRLTLNILLFTLTSSMGEPLVPPEGFGLSFSRTAL